MANHSETMWLSLVGGTMLGCAVAGSGAPDGGPGSPTTDAGRRDSDGSTDPHDAGRGQPDALPRRPDAGPQDACAQALEAYAYSFDSDDQGWTHRQLPEVDPPPVSWRFDHWERGAATSGPGACRGGACWATNLTGNYISCQRAYLQSPAMDLSACAGRAVTLRLFHAYDFWTGQWSSQTWYDGGLIELSGDGSVWQSAPTDYTGTVLINPNMSSNYACVNASQFYVHNEPGYVGTSGGWQEVAFEVPEALKTGGFRLRLVYASGVSAQVSSQSQSQTYTRPGWYLDDVSLTAAP